MSPSGGSTLMTSAPMSAMIWVQYGPITTAVRSSTRTPANGPSAMQNLLSRHREAVADVLVVPIRYDGEHDGFRPIADGFDVLAHRFDRPGRPVHAGRL